MVQYRHETVYELYNSLHKRRVEKPTNRCLQTQYLPDNHTGENLAEAMMLALEAWELDVARQVCLTTDNGSNI